eukprot:1958024-Rhodomonas_salina.1
MPWMSQIRRSRPEASYVKWQNACLPRDTRVSAHVTRRVGRRRARLAWGVRRCDAICPSLVLCLV